MSRRGFKTMKTRHEGKTRSRLLFDALTTEDEQRAYHWRYNGREFYDYEYESYMDECLPSAEEDCYHDWDWYGNYEYYLDSMDEELRRTRSMSVR